MINRIKKVAVFGERNSGTKWLSTILRQCIKEQGLTCEVITNSNETGWKHLDFGMAGQSERLESLVKRNLDSRELLIIWISKDPIAWCLSMIEKPYNLHIENTDSLRSQDKVSLDDLACGSEVVEVADTERLAEYVGARYGIWSEFAYYRNLPAMLRIKKVHFFSGLVRMKYHIVAHVQYEDLLRSPERVIAYLNSFCTARGLSFPVAPLEIHETQALNYSKRNYYLHGEYMDKLSVSAMEFIRETTETRFGQV